jgi:hypothetical protein
MGNEEPGLKPEIPADNFFDRRGELAPGRKGRRAARTAPYAIGNTRRENLNGADCFTFEEFGVGSEAEGF